MKEMVLKNGKKEFWLECFGIFMFVMEIKLNHNPENKLNLNTLQKLKLMKTIKTTTVIRFLKHTYKN